MEPILGIDLGTTNSLVGVVDSGFPILLANAEGERITPSVVSYQEDSVLVGGSAMRMSSVAPLSTIASVKRLMGRRFEDIDPSEFPQTLRRAPDGTILIDLGESPVSPEQVSSEILLRLKEIAETALETSVSKAVITVPAYFNDAQRQATKRAGELAGLSVERIVNEPTAAALAYGLDKLDERSRIAVYDLGGGTFDISILELNHGVFQVVATTGDTRLGGDDIDQAIIRWLGFDPQNSPPESLPRVLEAARQAKETLSSRDEVTIQLPFLDKGENLAKTLTRLEFEKLAKPIVSRTKAHCLKALADAGITSPAEELDQVILVGGSTRMPLARQLVADIFGQEPNTSQNPDEAIALGAAIQGGILSGAVRDLILLDVTPLSLGIETFGGLMNVIIPRNTTIPAKAGEMFTNGMANQKSMLIRVLQGEREMARDNWELGQFQIDFEPGAKGSARVGVQFEIDENGILKILARDTATQTDQVLEIKSAAVNVDDEEVEQMISESIDFAFDDMNERVWTEASLKSKELLPAVDLALEKVGHLLDEETKSRIEAAYEQVKAALEAKSPDVNGLKTANAELDDATEHLAAMLVDQAMTKALDLE